MNRVKRLRKCSPIAMVVVILCIFCLSTLWMGMHLLESMPSFKSTTIEPENLAETRKDTKHEILPSCVKLMQNPSLPYAASGAFLTSKSTEVVWKMRHDGSRELTLPHVCRLKRYTAQQAGQCLRKKSMLFIGDSLTRYQFLSLAYFLEHKKWPPRYQTTGFQPCTQMDDHNNTVCSEVDQPNVCCEYDWERNGHGGWHGFMQKLGGGTDGALFHGRMELQSVRATDSIEQYQYVSSEADGKTKLSSVLEYGWNGNEPIRGWNLTGCAGLGTCRYTPEMYQKNVERNAKKDWDWDYPNITTAFGTGAALRNKFQGTNYILYNRGLWGAIQPDKASMMMEALRDMTGGKDKISNRCFFKSSTGSERAINNNLEAIEYGVVRKTAHNLGCEYFDVAHITEAFSKLIFDPKAPPHLGEEYKHVLWDSLHYVSNFFCDHGNPHLVSLKLLFYHLASMGIRRIKQLTAECFVQCSCILLN